jgi:hypothetical protein
MCRLLAPFPRGRKSAHRGPSPHLADHRHTPQQQSLRARRDSRLLFRQRLPQDSWLQERPQVTSPGKASRGRWVSELWPRSGPNPHGHSLRRCLATTLLQPHAHPRRSRSSLLAVMPRADVLWTRRQAGRSRSGSAACASRTRPVLRMRLVVRGPPSRSTSRTARPVLQRRLAVHGPPSSQTASREMSAPIVGHSRGRADSSTGATSSCCLPCKTSCSS